MRQIPYELLVDLAKGRMGDTEAAELRGRVAADPAARAQLASLEALIDLMRSDATVDAPDLCDQPGAAPRTPARRRPRAEPAPADRRCAEDR